MKRVRHSGVTGTVRTLAAVALRAPVLSAGVAFAQSSDPDAERDRVRQAEATTVQMLDELTKQGVAAEKKAEQAKAAVTKAESNHRTSASCRRRVETSSSCPSRDQAARTRRSTATPSLKKLAVDSFIDDGVDDELQIFDDKAPADAGQTRDDSQSRRRRRWRRLSKRFEPIARIWTSDARNSWMQNREPRQKQKRQKTEAIRLEAAEKRAEEAALADLEAEVEAMTS